MRRACLTIVSYRACLILSAFFSFRALVSIGYATFVAPKTAWGGFDRKEAFRKLGTITSLGLAGKLEPEFVPSNAAEPFQ